MGFFILADDSTNKLKVVRAMRGTTQTELSAATGINQVKLSRIESGAVTPTAAEREAIASALDIDQSLLFAAARQEAGA